MTPRSHRLHVSGHRYLMRRAEAALLLGDPDTDPGSVAAPRIWFGCGAVLAVVALAGWAVLPMLGAAHPGG